MNAIPPRWAEAILRLCLAANLPRRNLLDEHATLLDLQLATNGRGPYLCSQRAAAMLARLRGVGSIEGPGQYRLRELIRQL